LIAAAFIENSRLPISWAALHCASVGGSAAKSLDGSELVGVLQDCSHDLLHEMIAHHKR